MAFPWSRSTTRSEVSSAERRRRKLERRARSDDTSQESTQSSKDRRHLRLSWAIGASLILVVVGVLAAGYYQEFYRPPRVWAGQVRDVQFTMGDLVERIRVQQGLTGTVDLTKEPFDYLQRLLNAEILRQEAPRLGIVVTDEIVERALRDQFYPEAQAGQETDPGQLDREFRNNLQIVLAQSWAFGRRIPRDCRGAAAAVGALFYVGPRDRRLNGTSGSFVDPLGCPRRSNRLRCDNQARDRGVSTPSPRV